MNYRFTGRTFHLGVKELMKNGDRTKATSIYILSEVGLGVNTKARLQMKGRLTSYKFTWHSWFHFNGTQAIHD